MVCEPPVKIIFKHMYLNSRIELNSSELQTSLSTTLGKKINFAFFKYFKRIYVSFFSSK